MKHQRSQEPDLSTRNARSQILANKRKKRLSRQNGNEIWKSAKVSTTTTDGRNDDKVTLHDKIISDTRNERTTDNAISVVSTSTGTVSLSHLLVFVGIGGGRVEAVAFVLVFHDGVVLADLGLIWIGFPFEMMMMGIGKGGKGGGFLLYGIRTPAVGTRPGL